MFQLFQTFPQLPPELKDLIPFLTSAEILLAVFMLYLQLPFLKEWPDWQKGGVYVVVASFVSGVGIAVQGLLTPELLATLQPFYEKFVIVLTLVLGFFALRNTVVRPLAGLWQDFKATRRLKREEKMATIAAINRAQQQRG